MKPGSQFTSRAHGFLPLAVGRHPVPPARSAVRRVMPLPLILATTACTDVPSPEPAIDAACRAEVVRLHRFFDEWFRGVLPDDDTASAAFERSLAADFAIVTPGGDRLERAALTAALRARHGAERGTDFAIEVRGVASRPVADGLAVVEYEEWQRRDGAWRGRRSTALIVWDRPVPLWIRVHETWLP